MKKELLLVDLLVVILAVFLTGCDLDTSLLNSIKSEPSIKWLGFYYKDAVYPSNQLSLQKMLDEAPSFSSIQACVNWGKELLAKNPAAGFECSYGCRYEEGVYSEGVGTTVGEGIVCKDTTKMITRLEKEGIWGD